MKIIFTSLLTLLLTASTMVAQNNVEFDASQGWIGYMNVFETAANGGAYSFGDFWGVTDLKSTIDVGANTLVLQPNFNTYAQNSTDPFWVDQATMEGNKDMEATTFVEPGDTFNGSDLTFSGNVGANTLADGYTASFFIKALDPDNGYADALGGSKIMELPASGSFSVSATAAELAAGLVVQYGFIIRGTNANPADEAALGSVTINNMLTSTENIDKAVKTVSISPNPATEFFTINSKTTVVSYEVKNLAGQSLLKGTETAVDVAALTSGVYVVLVNLGDHSEVVKFVKN